MDEPVIGHWEELRRPTQAQSKHIVRGRVDILTGVSVDPIDSLVLGAELDIAFRDDLHAIDAHRAREGHAGARQDLNTSAGRATIRQTEV